MAISYTSLSIVAPPLALGLPPFSGLPLLLRLPTVLAILPVLGLRLPLIGLYLLLIGLCALIGLFTTVGLPTLVRLLSPNG